MNQQAKAESSPGWLVGCQLRDGGGTVEGDRDELVGLTFVVDRHGEIFSNYAEFRHGDSVEIQLGCVGVLGHKLLSFQIAVVSVIEAVFFALLLKLRR